jgi:hypothetical protein
MYFFSLYSYLTPHFLLFINENVASTIQEKSTHKWLNFEPFQAGMMTLSENANCKDSSLIINRLNSAQTRVGISYSIYILSFIRFISENKLHIKEHR